MHPWQRYALFEYLLLIVYLAHYIVRPHLDLIVFNLLSQCQLNLSQAAICPTIEKKKKTQHHMKVFTSARMFRLVICFSSQTVNAP